MVFSHAVLVLTLCGAGWVLPARTQSTALVPPAPATPINPTLQPDGTAVFHLVMPNAAKVELNLEGMKAPLPMTKARDGAWSVTVPKLAPQFYSYSFKVDGTDVLDPRNATLTTGFFDKENTFLVPGNPPMPWEVANVPHGVVHHHYYRSDIVGIDSEYYVYTPPNFDPGSKQKYPVVYLLHGYSDDPSAWTAMAKANVILDNLIAQRKARPMIIVMPLGYGTMEVIARGWASWKDRDLIRRNYRRFSDALFQELMPLVNQQYPLSDSRDDHAVAGLSMGGAESLLVGLNHIDDFAYVGGFSSAQLGENDFGSAFPGITTQSAPGINAKLRLLWIACGTEDELLDRNQKLITWLKGKGLQPTGVQTRGTHSWMVWRDNLTNFAPLLFQSK